MAATKPDKIREETYDMIRNSLEAHYDITPMGRCSEGLVYINHIDNEQVVIKVIRKKKPYDELQAVLNYEEQLENYNKKKV